MLNRQSSIESYGMMRTSCSLGFCVYHSYKSREAPDAPYHVASKDYVPTQSDLKPSVKVLSRKPAPTMVARKDPVSGMEQLVIDDDEEDEDAANKQKPLSAEELRLKAQKEREEKQRKYEEVRERLFGVSNPTSGSSSPGNVTPPAAKSNNDRNRGRGRASRDGRDSRPNSSAGNKQRQLYDPNYTAKPDSNYVQKKENHEPSTPSEEQIIRSPRGPDGSGRGGFGFTNRGGKIP